MSTTKKKKHPAGQVTKPGHDSEKPLYVMLPADRLERYKRLADLAGMTLREYVARALESFAASQTLATHDDAAAHGLFAGHSDPEWLMRRLHTHALRLGELEKRVDALQRRIDEQLGPDAGPAGLAKASDALERVERLEREFVAFANIAGRGYVPNLR